MTILECGEIFDVVKVIGYSVPNKDNKKKIDFST